MSGTRVEAADDPLSMGMLLVTTPGVEATFQLSSQRTP